MNIAVENIIIKKLSQNQLKDICSEMVKLAQDKHYAVIMHYQEKPPDDFIEEFEELVMNSRWENYLPKEYYTLNNLIIR